MNDRYSRRRFLRYSSLAGGALATMSASGRGELVAAGQRRSGARSSTVAPGAPPLPPIEGPSIVTDRSQFPATFNERPEFADEVAAGTLPPVDERIGLDPLVVSPLQAIGQYGGTIRRGFMGVGDRQNGIRFCAGPDSLLYWDYTRQNVIANIAAGFELSDDFTELVLHLRRGMRWSDGAPFGADDIVFWRDDVNLNDELSSGAAALQVGGERVVVEKVDDATVRFRAPGPHPLLPGLLAGWSDVGGQAGNGNSAGGGFAPKHYLSQFLPAYTSQRAVDDLAAEAGFESWVAHFNNRSSWELNPDLPVVTPWVVTRPLNDPPWVLSANPYSVWVDTDGNQLPYIGEITMEGTDSLEVIALRATSGDFDFQDRHLEVSQLPILLENEGRGDYTIHRTPGENMDYTIRLNLAYDADPVLGDLLRTVEFRRALSLGVDREQVNEAFFLGTSTVTATLVRDESPYFPGPEWRTMWATHDPDQANALLDEIGLGERDGAGWRLRPDGGGPIRLSYEAGGSFVNLVDVGEMIRGQWADIGIDMTVQSVQGNLLVERIQANQLMLTGGALTTGDPFLLSEGFLPTTMRGLSATIGAPYVRWFTSAGAEGTEPPESLRMTEAMDVYTRGLAAPEDERIELGKELYRIHADQVWTIGVCGFGLSIYGMYLASNRLRNVPRRILNSPHQKTPSNALPQTFFYG